MNTLFDPLYHTYAYRVSNAMKYVPYYRVSTAGQGKSGLGLSAQRDIVQRFLKGEDELLPEFIEVESGKRAAGLLR
jgi:DNA invertase Pin-like site-specific DNA recombinase